MMKQPGLSHCGNQRRPCLAAVTGYLLDVAFAAAGALERDKASDAWAAACARPALPPALATLQGLVKSHPAAAAAAASSTATSGGGGGGGSLLQLLHALESTTEHGIGSLSENALTALESSDAAAADAIAVGPGEQTLLAKSSTCIWNPRLLNDMAPCDAASNRPITVYRFPRRALTLCPQLCMGIQPDARFPARSADALPATLYGHFIQAMYRNRPIPARRPYIVELRRATKAGAYTCPLFGST